VLAVFLKSYPVAGEHLFLVRFDRPYALHQFERCATMRRALILSRNLLHVIDP
jgi:hypothetical protein